MRARFYAAGADSCVHARALTQRAACARELRSSLNLDLNLNPVPCTLCAREMRSSLNLKGK